MKNRVSLCILAICGGCILLKSCLGSNELPPKEEKEGDGLSSPPTQKVDPPSFASLNRGLLTTLRIHATTTAYRELVRPFRSTVRLGITHRGSADVVLDLDKAEVEQGITEGRKHVRIILPPPRLDEHSIGINPNNVTVKITSSPDADEYSQLRDRLFVDVTQKLKTTFTDFDVQAAKAQALLVLGNLYAQAGFKDVEIVWKDEQQKPQQPDTGSDLIKQGGMQ